MEGIAVAAALALVLVNAGVSRHVRRIETLTGAQKRAQLAIVWRMPVVGAAVVFSVNRALASPARAKGRRLHQTMTDDEALDLATGWRHGTVCGICDGDGE